MCKMIEIGRDAVPSSITIEFERDASLRATELVIVNRNRHGVEVNGFKVLCHDNGKISGGIKLTDGVDILPFAGE